MNSFAHQNLTKFELYLINVFYLEQCVHPLGHEAVLVLQEVQVCLTLYNRKRGKRDKLITSQLL